MKIPRSTKIPKVTTSWIPFQKAGAWTTILRVIKFHLLRHFPRFRKLDEVKKVALYEDRGAALLHTVLHILPFAGAVSLVILNFRSTYIGGVQSSRVIALQFVAKLLEVLIQASIAATTLGIIRQYVLQRNELPFGGLMAPYRTSDISFLWSLDFWGCITSSALRLKQRIMFCLTLPTAVLLAALVGPSSAVLMIPRPMNRPHHEYVWLLDETNLVYPDTVKLGYNGTLPEETLFNQTSAQSTIGFSNNWPLPTLDDGVLRGLKWSSESIYSDASGHEVFRKLATVPTLLTAQAANLLNFTGKATALAPQPFVYVDCSLSALDSDYVNGTFIDFGPSRSYLNNYLNLSTLLPGYTQPPHDDSLAIYQTTPDFLIQQSENLTLMISLVWSTPPPDYNNNSLLLAFGWVYADGNTSMYQNNSYVTQDVACTIDAFWASVPTDVSLNLVAQSKLPESRKDDPTMTLIHLKDKIPITLSPEWAQKVGASIIERSNVDTLTDLFEATDTLPYALALSYQPELHKYVEKFNDMIPYYYVSQDNNNIWRHNESVSDDQYNALLRYIPTMNLKTGYDIYILTNSTNWTDPSTLAQLRFTSFQSGYGYDLSPTTVKLALAVLLFYLAATTAYLIYSVYTGYAATSWDSIAELTALALNSERPGDLANTSVGVDTLETFRRPVSIQANQQDSLEIVFEGSSQTGLYRRVKVSEKY